MALVQKPFSDIITFTRASGGGRFNAQGQYEWLPANQPRIDYDPVTGECRGLLIEEQRTNLLTYSSDFTNAVWNKSNTTIISSELVAPDGLASVSKLVEAATTGIHWVSQQKTVAIDTAYTFFAILKAGERHKARLVITNSGTGATIGAAIFDLLTGSAIQDAGVARITPLGGGFYLCGVTATTVGAVASVYVQTVTASNMFSYTGDGTSGIYIWGAQLEAGAFPTSYIPTPATFTGRASTGTYFDANGVLKIAAVGEARYTHAYIDGQWVSAGLLLEESRTNLLTYSENMLLAGALNSGMLRVANSFNMGLSNFIELRDEVSTDAFWYCGTPGNATSTYSFSIYVKKTENNLHKLSIWSVTAPTTQVSIVVVDTNTGVVTAKNGNATGVIEDAGDAWRVTVTSTTGAGDTGIQFRVYPAFNTNGSVNRDSSILGSNIVGMPQLEVGSFPTSYIPTADAQVTRAADTSTSSQVTRAADIASVNELSPWFNASEGTLYFKGNSRFFSRLGQTSVWLQQGGYTGFRLYRQTSTQLWTLWNTLDGQGDSIADVAANLGEFTHAASYSSSGISTSANGGTPTVVQANRTGFAPTSLRIGAYNLGYYFNGHIESIRYFPHALASEELQRITA